MPNCALGGIISTYTHDPVHASQFLRCLAICIILLNSVLRLRLKNPQIFLHSQVENQQPSPGAPLPCFARLNVTLGHQRINKTVERLQHDHASKVWKWYEEHCKRGVWSGIRRRELLTRTKILVTRLVVFLNLFSLLVLFVPLVTTMRTIRRCIIYMTC